MIVFYIHGPRIRIRIVHFQELQINHRSSAFMLRLKPQTLSLQAEDLLILDEERKRQAAQRAASAAAAAASFESTSAAHELPASKAQPTTAAELKAERQKEIAARIGLPVAHAPSIAATSSVPRH
jgi:hypothetical protein